MSYSPPYRLTDRMLWLVSSISEKIGQDCCRRNLEARPHLRRAAAIQSVCSTLKMDGKLFTFSDIQDMIVGVSQDDPEVREVKNTFAAYERFGDFDPYHEDDFLSAHGLMMNGMSSVPGRWRDGESGLFYKGRCIFIAPPPNMVPEMMTALFGWMEENRGTIHPLILSAAFHYEYMFIYPFDEGCGRMARMWHKAILADWKPVFRNVPFEKQLESCEEDYYGQFDGSAESFIEFILDQIDSAVDELVGEIGRGVSLESEYVKRLLAAMEYDVPYTAGSIMETLGLKSKETFRKHYLGPAMDAGLVAMTIPDKPNSRNQRYIKR